MNPYCSRIVHRYDQAAELDSRVVVSPGAVPFLVLERIVAEALPFGFFDPDGDAVSGVVEADAVVESETRPELAVRVVAVGGVPFVSELGKPVSDLGVEPADLPVSRTTPM